MQNRTLRGYVNDHIGIRSEWADSNPNMADSDRMTHWRVTLTNRQNRHRMTVPFSMGLAHTGEPQALDVLDCLLSDYDTAGEGFDEWAMSLGYDEDSRKAERTYRAVVKQSAKLARFLGDDLEAVRYLER